MSEYQYYEFRAIDRPLDERAMAKLRAITSRAEITPTSLVNVYHFGDFKGDPDRLIDQYFDAFLYVANWGTRRFMLRLPRRVFDLAAAEPYTVPYVLTARTTPDHVVLDFHSDSENGEDYFEGGEGWMASLIALRSDLLAGDLRCLYLGWLAGIESREVDDDALEPPVPPGLQHLSASLKRLADFLRVSDDLLDVAAKASSGEAPVGPSLDDMAAWVGTLPDTEKDRLLLRLMQGEPAHLSMELLHRFRMDQERVEVRPHRGGARDAGRRTVGELLEARDHRADERRRHAAERAAREQQRRAREQAEARARHLESLVGRERDLWREVETAIATKQPKEYDRAVDLLKDLRDLGERSGDAETVAARIRRLREQHGRKPTLIRRLDQAGLPR